MPLKDWDAHPGPQKTMLQCNHEEILYGGARGGGKSEGGLAWLIEPEYVSNPAYRSLVLRHDYSDLSDWLFRAKTFYQGMCEIRESNPPLIRWNWGGETRLGHFKDLDTISKYIGHEYWKMLFEESTQCVKTEKDYKMLLGSLRNSETNAKPQCLLTTNPGGPGHGWHKSYFVEKANMRTFKDPETGYRRIFIPAKATDNPSISPSYLSWLNGLPEPLRSAWRDGSWETYEGQFFTEFGEPIGAFEIPAVDLVGHLYAGLDGGTTHPTSFGLWWVAPHSQDYTRLFGVDQSIHRLMTYHGVGGSHATHAEAILEKLEAFPWTKGIMPDKIFYDYAMDTKVRLNEYSVRAPIDEYFDAWSKRGKKSQWVGANKDKHNGCQIMRQLFMPRNGVSRVKYWKAYNRDYIDGMMAVVVDKNDQEIYAKQDGDDECDGSRYAMVGIWSELGNKVQRDAGINKVHRHNAELKKKSWMEI